MRYLLLTTTALLALAPTVHAADAPTEVIVQANRFATYRGDRAFSTVDLSSDALRDAPSTDRALKQATQAALFRRSSSLTANPTVQGLSFRAIAPSGAGRALVTLDGIPQNDPLATGSSGRPSPATPWPMPISCAGQGAAPTVPAP